MFCWAISFHKCAPSASSIFVSQRTPHEGQRNFLVPGEPGLCGLGIQCLQFGHLQWFQKNRCTANSSIRQTTQIPKKHHEIIAEAIPNRSKYDQIAKITRNNPTVSATTTWVVLRCVGCHFVWGVIVLPNVEAWHPLPGAHLRFGLRFLVTFRLRLGAGSGLSSAGLFAVNFGD